MENQLQLLIKEYEAEKLRLQQWIDEFLEESDYLAAHYHSQAIYMVNRKLFTLKCMGDQLYEQKYFLERNIDNLKRRMVKNDFTYSREILEREISEKLHKIDQLNKLSASKPNHNQENILQQSLIGLIERKIKKCKLILSKKYDIYLNFTYSKRVMNVNMPHAKRLINQFFLTNEKISVFQQLGFSLSENQSVLTLKLTGDKNTIVSRLNSVLVRVIFEIFNHQDFSQDSYIQITDNS